MSGKTPLPFVVGVWAWPCADAPGLYPFIAAQLDRLLSRRLPHLLLCTAPRGGALGHVRRYAHVEGVGLFLVEGAQGVLAHADALAVFWDGGDAECVALAAQAHKRGVPARLVRVPGGEVAHLPLWDDLLQPACG
jgi:hypothetical protein